MQAQRASYAASDRSELLLASTFFDSRKVTICQRCCLGSCDQDGIPLFRSPLVMNQKSSPGLAFLRGRTSKSAPVPCPAGCCRGTARNSGRRASCRRLRPARHRSMGSSSARPMRARCEKFGRQHAAPCRVMADRCQKCGMADQKAQASTQGSPPRLLFYREVSAKQLLAACGRNPLISYCTPKRNMAR